jgi:CubicO group peptidase (beta-lactamase class C family)
MSTAEDYWRFAQAVLNGGELMGKRVLQGRHGEADAHQRDLAHGKGRPLRPEPGRHRLRHGLRDRDGPAEGGTPQGLNTFYWGGAFGTWFWIDPTNDLVFVGMIQNLNGSNPAQRHARHARNLSAHHL